VSPRNKRWCRRLLVGLSLALFLGTTPLGFSWLWSLKDLVWPPQKVAALAYAEATQKAVEGRLELSTNLFHAASLLLGSGWGLLLVKKDEAQVVLKRPAERCLLLLASATLASSMWGHISFVMQMTAHVARTAGATTGGKLPDLGNHEVAYALFAQGSALLAGAAIVVLMLGSAAWLKD
jgi:hypothetical protein